MPPDEPHDVLGGRYTLLRRLGEGSQGATWEARDNGPGASRPAPERLTADFHAYVKRAREGDAAPVVRGLVAVKQFRLDRAKAWKDVELAEREARILASLSHPRLPRYVTHFEEDGALYLVMEKIEGESLATIRARGGTLAPGEVERMIAEVGEALGYLHGRAPAVVHRDVKPGNVIRRPDGSFALVDFGAVRDKLKPQGGSTVVGTFGYMAPEQFQGRASARSDMYGLGATALAMLTGVEPEELPHRGLAVDVENAVPAGTQRPLVRALVAMLTPDPDARVASLDEVLPILRATPAPREREPTREKKPPRTKAERRKERREAREVAREAKRARRARARARAAPFFPRVIAQLGLAIAIVVVWLTVGIVTPMVLGLLSVLFGPALRRAARACHDAAARSTAAMGRASQWLSGYRVEEEETREEAAPARVRVGSEEDVRARVADEEEAAAPTDEEETDEAASPPPKAARRRG